MAAAQNYEQILYEVEEGTATITLNRPDKLNAFTEKMKLELLDAFDRADADDEVRAIIVTGAGRGFCAGADLSRGAGTFDQAARGARSVHRDGGGELTLRIFECLKPVIAACNGPAVGVGATMQCAMDIRLGSSLARYGFVFSRRGVIPEACSSWFLPRIVGISQALEWSYSGRVFDAAEAEAGGLIKQVLEPAALLPEARRLAREFADQTASVSVAMIRQMMWQMLTADHPMEAHQVDSTGFFHMGGGADAAEGVQSFLEKRPARFPGRVSKDMPKFFPWWKARNFKPHS